MSGVSLLIYFAHRVNPTHFSAALADGRVHAITASNSYLDNVRPGSALVQTQPIDCPCAVELPTASDLGGCESVTLEQSLLWMGGDYALSVVPIVLSTGGLDVRAHVTVASPLTVDDCLALVRDVTEKALRDHLTQGVHSSTASLDICGDEEAATWFMDDCLAIQIWNLDGTSARPGSTLYDGLAETRQYAWEISALLGASSDHILRDGLWRRRSADQVYFELGSGFAFFPDHMVLVNSSCCLEITHLPAWLRDRSRFRLEAYGYDSSSIFVWSVAMLRSAVTGDLTNRYRESLAQLVERSGMTSEEETELTRTQYSHAALCDRLAAFRGNLKEPRNRAFDEYVALIRGDDRALGLLSKDMEKTSALANSLARLREQTMQARSTTALGVLAVALAMTSIPSIIAQFSTWVNGGHWGLLIGSLLVMLCLLGILPLVWWKSR